MQALQVLAVQLRQLESAQGVQLPEASGRYVPSGQLHAPRISVWPLLHEIWQAFLEFSLKPIAQI
jgi:hypothetical protein